MWLLPTQFYRKWGACEHLIFKLNRYALLIILLDPSAKFNPVNHFCLFGTLTFLRFPWGRSIAVLVPLISLVASAFFTPHLFVGVPQDRLCLFLFIHTFLWASNPHLVTIISPTTASSTDDSPESQIHMFPHHLEVPKGLQIYHIYTQILFSLSGIPYLRYNHSPAM